MAARKRQGGRLSGFAKALFRKTLAASRSRAFERYKSTVCSPLSTARNKYIHRPATRTKVSSMCHHAGCSLEVRLLGSFGAPRTCAMTPLYGDPYRWQRGVGRCHASLPDAGRCRLRELANDVQNLELIYTQDSVQCSFSAVASHSSKNWTPA